MKIIILGGDGFCGWPCAVNLVDAGHDVVIVDNRCLIELGLKPTTLDDGLLAEVVDVARRWADRCDRSRIPCQSAWTR